MAVRRSPHSSAQPDAAHWLPPGTEGWFWPFQFSVTPHFDFHLERMNGTGPFHSTSGVPGGSKLLPPGTGKCVRQRHCGKAVPGGMTVPVHCGKAVPDGMTVPVHCGKAVPGGMTVPVHCGKAVPGGMTVPVHCRKAVPGGKTVPVHCGKAVPDGMTVPVHCGKAVLG